MENRCVLSAQSLGPDDINLKVFFIKRANKTRNEPPPSNQEKTGSLSESYVLSFVLLSSWL